jgi:chemotaxis-related protein WspD
VRLREPGRSTTAPSGLARRFERRVNPSDADQPAPATDVTLVPVANASTGPRSCWSDVGVQGNATCPELKKFTHCRNCPVYANAAMELLDRPLLPQYRREWSEHFAKPRQLAAPPKSSALIFRLNTDWLALPTHALQEIAENRLLHSLPHRRQGMVLGLVNIRGELLICVALGRLLGLEPAATNGGSGLSFDRLLVTNWDGNRLVFPADEVYGIHRFHLDELKELPGTVTRAETTYTLGLLNWRGRAIGFLDAARLFSTLNRTLA